MAYQKLRLLLRLQQGYSSMKIQAQTFSLMLNLTDEEVDNEDTKEAGEDINNINRVEEAASSLLNRKRVKTITKFLD